MSLGAPIQPTTLGGRDQAPALYATRSLCPAGWHPGPNSRESLQPCAGRQLTAPVQRGVRLRQGKGSWPWPRRVGTK